MPQRGRHTLGADEKVAILKSYKLKLEIIWSMLLFRCKFQYFGILLEGKWINRIILHFLRPCLYGGELPGWPSYSVCRDKVTNKCFVYIYMEVPQSSGKHACSFGKSSSRLAEFPGQSIYMVKYSSCLGEIPPLSSFHQKLTKANFPVCAM